MRLAFRYGSPNTFSPRVSKMLEPNLVELQILAIDYRASSFAPCVSSRLARRRNTYGFTHTCRQISHSLCTKESQLAAFYFLWFLSFSPPNISTASFLPSISISPPLAPHHTSSRRLPFVRCTGNIRRLRRILRESDSPGLTDLLEPPPCCAHARPPR